METENLVILIKRGAVLEARYTRYTGTDKMRVRYLAPVVSEWIAEQYSLSMLQAAGWKRLGCDMICRCKAYTTGDNTCS